MITEGRTFMATAWWISLFPGLAVVITGSAFPTFSDGLADTKPCSLVSTVQQSSRSSRSMLTPGSDAIGTMPPVETDST